MKDFKSFLFADSHGRPLENLFDSYGIFNFSIGSDSYEDILRKIKFLLNKDVKIEQIILSVDDHTLSFYRERLSNHDRSIKYVRFGEYNLYKLFKEKYLSLYFPLLNPKSRDILVLVINSHFSERIEFKAVTLEWADEKNKLKKVERRFNQQFPDPHRSDRLIKSLEEIISISSQNDIELIGIKFPLSGDLVNRIGKVTFGADSILLVGGFKVLDYKDLFVDHDEYFEDQDHLNLEGAKLLVQRLTEDLKIHPSVNQ